jgi:hypothetical protein
VFPKIFFKYLVVLAEGGVELFHVRELVAGTSFKAGAQWGDGKLLILLASNREVRLWKRNSNPQVYVLKYRYRTQCCGSGSGIQCLFDPWIRDPGWVKNQQDRYPG